MTWAFQASVFWGMSCQRAINDYLEHHNANPKPFVWTASASSIIEKVNRGKQALKSQH